MSYQQKDNTGSLHRNERKEKDTHPNATGSATIDSVEYWISAWTKKDKNGNLYQSLAFKRKEERINKSGFREGGGRDPKHDGEIPF